MRLQSPHRADRALGTGKENEFLYLGLGGSKGDPGEEPKHPVRPGRSQPSDTGRARRSSLVGRNYHPALDCFQRFLFFFFLPFKQLAHSSL